MSPRPRDTQRGGGPFDGDDDQTELSGSNFEDTNPELKAPPSRALVVQKRRSLIVAEALPQAARLPSGMANEQQLDNFRELRTRLLSMAASLGMEQFITLVVALEPGSGASFVARNLAAAFTLEDDRIAVLVDCNLRHPSQHQALSTRADDGGLFEFLDSPHPNLDRLVRPTGVSGLHLIPAGRASNPYREYFSSQAMRGVIAALREEPCYVFLDGPPAKGSPDARILSGLVDFVILVVGYGRSTTEAIAQAAALFDPAKFAGVVFNERE